MVNGQPGGGRRAGTTWELKATRTYELTLNGYLMESVLWERWGSAAGERERKLAAEPKLDSAVLVKNVKLFTNLHRHRHLREIMEVSPSILMDSHDKSRQKARLGSWGLPIRGRQSGGGATVPRASEPSLGVFPLSGGLGSVR